MSRVNLYYRNLIAEMQRRVDALDARRPALDPDPELTALTDMVGRANARFLLRMKAAYVAQVYGPSARRRA